MQLYHDGEPRAPDKLRSSYAGPAAHARLSAGCPVAHNQNVMTAGPRGPQLLQVNAPRCPAHSYHRDGTMRVDGNRGGPLGYEPNSYGEWQEQPDFAEPPLSLAGAADHWNHREDTARSIGDALRETKVRHIGNCLKADPA